MRKEIFSIFLILLVSGVGCKKKGAEGQAAAEAEGAKKAAAFTLANYDGSKVSLSDYAGKTVVLEWFNYECPFVRFHYETVSTMVEIADEYEDENVVWLAINSTMHQTTEQNKAYAEKNDVPYPILDDRDGRTGKAYGALRTPHIFIIDTDGNIVYEGAIDDSPLGKKGEDATNYVGKALAELTEGKQISTAKTEPYGCTVKYAQ